MQNLSRLLCDAFGMPEKLKSLRAASESIEVSVSSCGPQASAFYLSGRRYNQLIDFAKVILQFRWGAKAFCASSPVDH